MQKLDPKTKWLFFVRYFFSVLALGLFVVPTVAAASALIALIVALVLIIGAYVAAYLSYTCYSYQLADDAFRKEFGVITRRRTSIPYERIQNVDIIRGLLSRMIGLSDLNIQTAGGSSYGMRSEGRLPGLSKVQAIEMQTELLALAKGLQPTKPATTQHVRSQATPESTGGV